MVLRLVLGDQGGFTSVSFSGRYRAVRADQGLWASRQQYHTENKTCDFWIGYRVGDVGGGGEPLT